MEKATTMSMYIYIGHACVYISKLITIRVKYILLNAQTNFHDDSVCVRRAICTRLKYSSQKNHEISVNL